VADDTSASPGCETHSDAGEKDGRHNNGSPAINPDGVSTN
jgi:hypothetical protein